MVASWSIGPTRRSCRRVRSSRTPESSDTRGPADTPRGQTARRMAARTSPPFNTPISPRELRRNRFARVRACQRGAFAIECLSVASRQAIRAFSSGGERFPDTEEVRSSNLLTPTIHSQPRGYVSGLLSFAPRLVHARSAQLVSAQLVHTLSAKPWATIRSWTRLPYNLGAFYLTIMGLSTLQSRSTLPYNFGNSIPGAIIGHALQEEI